MSADEAKELGLIDSVLVSPPKVGNSNKESNTSTDSKENDKKDESW